MNTNIDLLRQDILHYTEGGYITRENQDILYARGKSYGVPKSEIDTELSKVISSIRAQYLQGIFENCPCPAIEENPVFRKDSPRCFPEVLNIGSLKMRINHKETIPAFIPIKGTAGVACFFDGKNDREKACNIIQNLTIRMLLSLPKSMAKVSMFDLRQYGMSFRGLAGLDNRILERQVDDKKLMAFFEEESDRMSDFIFTQLGSYYNNIEEYNDNVDNDSRVPYQIIICSGLPAFGNNAPKQEAWDEFAQRFEQMLPNANQAGRLFLIAVDTNEIPESICETIKNHMTVLDLSEKEPRMLVSRPLPIMENGYTMTVRHDLCFTPQDSISMLNNELDPIRYPFNKPAKKRLDTLDAIQISFDGKEVAFKLDSGKGQNVFHFSNDKKMSAETQLRVVSYLDKCYGPDELEYAFLNCDWLPEANRLEGVVANVNSNKFHYIQGFVDMLWNMAESRKTLFGDKDYTQFRKSANVPCPRVFCFISGVDKWFAHDEFFMAMSRLNDLLGCAKYGFHFFLEGKMHENFLAINFQDSIRHILLSKVDTDDLLPLGLAVGGTSVLSKTNLALFDTKSYSLTDANIKLMPASENAVMLKSLTAPIATSYQKPPVFVDTNDKRPSIYDSIRCDWSKTIHDRRIPVGIPRFYQEDFYCLDLGSTETGAKRIAVFGNSSEGLVSIMKSVKSWAEARDETFQLYDASNKGFDSLDLQTQSVHGIDQLEMKPGIICLSNMDTYPTSEMPAFHALLNKVITAGTDLVLLAKYDLFQKAEWSMVKFDFKTKLNLLDDLEACTDDERFWLFKYPLAELEKREKIAK
jgi:hypothetical protein